MKNNMEKSQLVNFMLQNYQFSRVNEVFVRLWSVGQTHNGAPSSIKIDFWVNYYKYRMV